MNYLNLLGTYNLICQRENSGTLVQLRTPVVLNTWVNFSQVCKKREN